MDIRVKQIYGINAHSINGITLVPWQNSWAYVACVGAGVVLTPIPRRDSPSLTSGGYSQRFYYKPPAVDDAHHGKAASPTASPELSPTHHRLIRVNKANCTDSSAQSGLVAVGESGGYMPRLLLYDLRSGKCLDVLKDQHQFGVQFVRFSPSGKLLASIGTPQDGYIYVWNVRGGKLEQLASNKCISDVRDMAWINDSQLATVGVRHIRIWTVGTENTLAGRNVVLGEAADQTFDCILPGAAASTEFLTGSTRGAIMRIPDVVEVARVPDQKAITSLAATVDRYFASTQTGTFEFSGDFTRLNLVRRYAVATPVLLSTNNEIYYLSLQHQHSSSVQRLDGNPSYVPIDGSCPPLVGRQLQLRADVTGNLVSWNTGDNAIYQYPFQVRKELPINDITVVFKSDHDIIVGSLAGDVFIGNTTFNAHNGPVTDVHILGSLAVSSGRDRCVQIWAKASGQTKWDLQQTIMLTSPILKTKLCADAEGKIALICCAANKTVYFYSTRAPPEVDGETAGRPIFEDSARSLVLKGMPYDLASHNDVFVLSTNDKTVTIFDPFAPENKIRTSWRAADSNGDPVNLPHIQALECEGTIYLAAAASNKSLLLFLLPSGHLVASQWGHGEAISGIGWSGAEIVSASDAIVVSEVVNKDLGDEISFLSIGGSGNTSSGSIGSATNSGHSYSNAPILPSVAPATPASVADLPPPRPEPTAGRRQSVISATGASVRGTSPLRKVFNTSPKLRARSVSPQRSPSPRTLARSPSPVRERGRRPGDLDDSRTLGKDLQQRSLAYKPLKLALPTSPARSVAELAQQSHPSSIPVSPAQALEGALKAFLESSQPIEDTDQLKYLLACALNKIDAFALAEEMSKQLSAKLDAEIERRLSTLTKSE